MMKQDRTVELSQIQRQILILLEEAGEENLAALTNSVGNAHDGSPQELEVVAAALTGLFAQGLVEASTSRDATSRHWIPEPKERARLLFADLRPLLRWSASEKSWKWEAADVPRVQALLTDTGSAAAREILAATGYPKID
jgi:hypothetical protein